MSEQQSHLDRLLALIREINEGLEAINEVLEKHTPSAFLQGFNAERYFTDEQLERFLADESLDALAERGFLDEPSTDAPDGWLHLTPTQLSDEYGLSDAELIFQLDTEADGGESL